jgi:hypothetical protein
LTYFLCFQDVRQATNAHKQAELYKENHPSTCKWTVHYSQYSEYIEAVGPEVDPRDKPPSYYDGQVVFAVSFGGSTEEFTNHNNASKEIEKIVRDIADSFGEVMAFDGLPTTKFPDIKYRVEYYRLDVAFKALAEVTDAQPKVVDVSPLPLFPLSRTCWLTFPPQKWSVRAEKYMPRDNVSSLNGNAAEHVATPHRNGVSGPDANGVYWSPTGRTAFKINENGEKESIATEFTPKPSTPSFGSIAEVMNGGMPQTFFTPTVGRFHNSLPSGPTPNGFNYYATPRSQSDPHQYQSLQSYQPYPPYQPYGSYGPYQHAGQGGYYHGGGPYGRGTRPVPNPQTIDLNKIRHGQDVRTTIMLRNIPNR